MGGGAVIIIMIVPRAYEYLNPVFAQLFKKFPTFYGTRRFAADHKSHTGPCHEPFLIQCMPLHPIWDAF
jgi:hypothetical protein